MNEKDGSLRQGNLNLNILFELLSHKETNFAFFAVSRIRVISKIIGTHKKISRSKKDERGADSWAKKVCNQNITVVRNQSTSCSAYKLTLGKKPYKILNPQYIQLFPLWISFNFPLLICTLSFIFYFIGFLFWPLFFGGSMFRVQVDCWIW